MRACSDWHQLTFNNEHSTTSLSDGHRSTGGSCSSQLPNVHNSCCAPEEKCVGFADNAQCIHCHSCVGVVCPPNKRCLVKTVGEKSRAVCVAKHSCVDVTCQPDQQCKLVNGLAQCSPLSTCEGVICPSNMKCKVNKSTGQAQCQSSCTSSICPSSMRCVEHDDNRMECFTWKMQEQ